MEEDPENPVQLGATYLCRKSNGTYQDAEVVKMRSNERAQREEYMVRYTGLPHRQIEWVDKTRLVLRRQQRDEDPEEGNVQMPESGRKTDEDEPEIKKAKVGDPGAASDSSMVTTGGLDGDITCVLCGNLCEHPIRGECGNNFCSGCVSKAWEALMEKQRSTDEALANAVTEESHSPDTPVQPEGSEPSNNCAVHGEKVKLYCKDDGILCCVICQDSVKHFHHRFMPIQEAVSTCRAELSATITSMEEAFNELEKLDLLPSEDVELQTSDLTEYKLNIVSEFKKLYTFLEEQKRKMLEQLKQHGQSMLEQMETSVAWCHRSKMDLQEALAMVNEKTKDTNPYSFLNGVKSFLETVQEQRQAVLTSRETLNEVKLCQGTFKGPLQYIIWRQMKSIIGPIAAMLLLKLLNWGRVPEQDDPLNRTFLDPLKENSVKKSHQPPEPEDIKGKLEEIAEAAAGAPKAPPAHMLLPSEDFSDLMDKGCKEVWIVGETCLDAARCVAKTGPYSENLGIPESVCRVNWIQKKYNLWSELHKRLLDRASSQGKPDILFIYTGTHELRYTGLGSVNTCALKALYDIVECFPRTSIVLSTLLPRKGSQGTALEQRRRSFNAVLCQFAEMHQVQILKHEELEEAALADTFYKKGDFKLSDSELEVFIKDLRNALINELRGPIKAPEKALEQQKVSIMSPIAKSNVHTFMEVESVRLKECDQQLEPEECEEEPEEIAAEAPGCKEIWIVGEAFLVSAKRVAENSQGGKNLGIPQSVCHVHWLHKPHKLWSELCTKLQHRASTEGKPDVLFVYTGICDLRSDDSEAVNTCALTALYNLVKLFPQTSIVLSTLLPRQDWQGTDLEESRKALNAALCQFAEKHHFQILKHEDLESALFDRFRKEKNVRIDEAGIKLFVSNLRNALMNELTGSRKAPEKGPEQQKSNIVSPIAGRNVESVKKMEPMRVKECDQQPEDSEEEPEEEEVAAEVPENAPAHVALPSKTAKENHKGTRATDAQRERTKAHMVLPSEDFSDMRNKVKEYNRQPEPEKSKEKPEDIEKAAAEVPKNYRVKECDKQPEPEDSEEEPEEIEEAAAAEAPDAPPAHVALPSKTAKENHKGTRATDAQRERTKAHTVLPSEDFSDMRNKVKEYNRQPEPEKSKEKPEDIEKAAAEVPKNYRVKECDQQPEDSEEEPEEEEVAAEVPEDAPAHVALPSKTAKENPKGTRATDAQRERTKAHMVLPSEDFSDMRNKVKEYNRQPEPEKSKEKPEDIEKAAAEVPKNYRVKECDQQPEDSEEEPEEEEVAAEVPEDAPAHVALPSKTAKENHKGTRATDAQRERTKAHMVLPSEDFSDMRNKVKEYNRQPEPEKSKEKPEDIEKAAAEVPKNYRVKECDKQPEPEDSDEEPEEIEEAAAAEAPDAPPVKECDLQPEDSEEDSEGIEEAAEAPEAPPAQILLPLEDFSDLMHKGTKEIWIVGETTLVSARWVAEKGPYTKNLAIPKSVCNVNWIQQKHNLWSEILSKLRKRAKTQRQPNILFVYTGTHELTHTSSESVNSCASKALYNIVKYFPRTSIVLSTLLPRKDWQGTAVEQRRKSLNTTLCQFAEKHHFQIVKHEELESALADQFGKGGDVRLNESELEVFVKNLRSAVIKELRGTWKTHEKSPEQQKVTSAIAGKKVESERHEECDRQQKPEDISKVATQALENPTAHKLLSEDFSDLRKKARKEIWIVGEAFLAVARRVMDVGPFSNNLGIPESVCRISWIHQQHNHWSQLPAKLQVRADLVPKPDILFVYTGSLELRHSDSDNANTCALKALSNVVNCFPHLSIVLSTLLPRKEWQGTDMEQRRKAFNAALCQYAEEQHFQILKHRELEAALFDRFGTEGIVRLNDAEIETFIKNLRSALIKELRRSTKVHKKDSEKQKTPITSSNAVKEVESVRRAEKPQALGAEAPSQPAPTSSKEPKFIWIIGNSYVYRAYGHAGKSKHGTSLGFKDFNLSFRWLGRTTRWNNVVRDLLQSVGSQGTPSAIFIHLGTEDLELGSCDCLINETGICLGQLTQRFPSTKLILSYVLPKAEWLGSHLEESRKMFNMYLSNCATRHNFQLGTHDKLEQQLLLRFRQGESLSSFLTVNENDQFIEDIRLFVLKALLQDYKMAHERSQQQKKIDASSSNTPNEVQHEGTSTKSIESSAGKLFATKESIEELLPENYGHINKPGTPRKLERLLAESSLVKVDQPRLMEVSDTDLRMAIEEDLSDSEDLPEHKIWVIGDADIHAIQMFVLNSSWGQKLGLEEHNWTVHWLDKTMHWCDLPAKIQNAIPVLGAPGAIYIHLGGEDLGRYRNRKLIGDVRSCLGQLAGLLPNTQLVFSPVLPRAEWMNKPLDDCRKKFNDSITKYAKVRGFDSIVHDELENMRTSRFKRGDRADALTDVEKERFVRAFKESLLRAMLKEPRACPKIPLLQPSCRKVQEEALSSGATLYLIPENYRRKCLERRKRYSSIQEDKDDSSSDGEESDDEEWTEFSDGGISDYEEADKDQTKMAKDERRSNIRKDRGMMESKQIWIIGGSFFCRAKQYAESKSYWNNLGLDKETWTVRWMGSISMRWESLAKEVVDARFKFGTPSVLIIHLGGNDLGCMAYKKFVKSVKYDFSCFTKHLPETQVIFSTILPRSEWLMTPVELVRLKFNKSMVVSSWKLCYHVLVHSNIEEKMKVQFESGRGSDLSDVEYHLLLTNLKECVQKVVKD